MTAQIQISDLQALHAEIVKPNGWIHFTKNLRQQKKDALIPGVSVKVAELIKRFASSCWNKLPTKSGHANFENKIIRHIHVGFSLHGQKDVYGNHLKSILDNVQSMINIMCDQVFGIPGWSTQPDFAASLKRYQKKFAKNTP